MFLIYELTTKILNKINIVYTSYHKNIHIALKSYFFLLLLLEKK